MTDQDRCNLLAELDEAVVAGQTPVGVLGPSALSVEVVRRLRAAGLAESGYAVYGEQSGADHGFEVRPWDSLARDAPKTVVVTVDDEKEIVLRAAAPYLIPSVQVIIGGYGHLQFRDPLFDRVVQDALVPSLANGYPHTLVHLYQCLRNAGVLGLSGVVAEFGAFKGGTTSILARLIREMGLSWPVIAFDTFDGFPEKRSPLDMYAHPGCVFQDERAVRAMVADLNVELVPGDIVETVEGRLSGESVVVAFFDTDNYSPAARALEVVRDRVPVGGVVVFDHYTGRNRFNYTLGERMAAGALVKDPRFFHLHDTGVFYKQYD